MPIVFGLIVMGSLSKKARKSGEATLRADLRKRPASSISTTTAAAERARRIHNSKILGGGRDLVQDEQPLWVL